MVKHTIHDIIGKTNSHIKNLMKKLNVEQYNVSTPYRDNPPTPNSVLLKLKQHTGEAARSVVVPNQNVNAGELVGKISNDVLGANIHASISGIVTEVTDDYVRINKK